MEIKQTTYTIELNQKCNSDEEHFWQKFSMLLDKFIREHRKTTVVIPKVNHRLENYNNSKKIESIVKEHNFNNIEYGGFFEIYANDVLDIAYEPDYDFYKHYNNGWNEAITKLNDFINTMNEENNGFFDYHYITDEEIRTHIIKSLEEENNRVAFYKHNINDKDILILDNDITNTQASEKMIDVISKTYQPMSISVIKRR